MIYVGIFVAVAFFCIAATQPGDTFLARLNNAYQWLVSRTTGQQYTDLMRENPWLYILPAVFILTLGGWLLPRQYWGRAIFLYVAFGLGFLAGHVFW
jgi:hypothetical protein